MTGGTVIPTMAERARAQDSGARAVLALDLGRHMGVAIQHVDGRIAHCVQEFPAVGGYGFSFLRFRTWLTETKNRAGGLDFVYFENNPFTRPGGDHNATEIHGAFKATLCAWCEHHRIPYAGIHNAKIKKFATGDGKAKKPQIIAAMKERGYPVTDNNEADALALLLFALDLIAKSEAA